MEQQRRKCRKLFWIVVVVGSGIVGVLSAMLDRQMLLPWVVLMGILSLGIDFFWQQKFMKKQAECNRILFEEKNPDLYIAQMQQMFEGVKGGQRQDCRNINLAVAYYIKEEYPKAMEYLKEVQPNRLRGFTRAAYWANKTLVCFSWGRTEEARQMLREQEPLFTKYAKRPDMAETLDTLQVWKRMSEQDWQGAEAALTEARRKWENDGNQEDFAKLAERCRKAKEEGGNGQ